MGTIQDIHQSQRVFQSIGAHLPSQTSGGIEGIQRQLGLHETLPKYTPPNQNQTPKETLEEGPFCEGWKGLPVWPREAEFHRHDCRLAVPEEGCILFQKIFQPRPDCNPNLTLWVISKYLLPCGAKVGALMGYLKQQTSSPQPGSPLYDCATSKE